MQYRSDFLVEGAISLFWMLTALIPLFVAYGHRDSIAGWTFAEALLVVGWFTLLSGITEGAINPSLSAVVEHIRKGTLDFVLLKPADAQFLVSTARFEPWQSSHVVSALAIFAYAFARLGGIPSLAGIVASLILLVSATLLLYSMWILTVCAAFYVVKVDNLTYLFNSIFDAARWPVSVFKGLLRLFFTFIIPLALMTTFPAEAMLGRLAPRVLLFSVLGSLAFAALARVLWLRSIGRYTSASS
jgi:ABC-2 type transport system permease protein